MFKKKIFDWFNLVKVEVLINDKFSHNVYISKRIIKDWNPDGREYTLIDNGDITDNIKKQSKKTRDCRIKCYFGYANNKNDNVKIDTNRYTVWFYTA